MRIIIIYPVVCFLFLLGSCASMKYGQINADMSLIKLGMHQDEVVQRIGKPAMVVAAQFTDEGPLEIYEYMRLDRNSYTEEFERRPIWVYFINGEVVEWGPGKDWQIDNAFTKRVLEKYRHQKNDK